MVRPVAARRSGFTVVELMISLVIIGVMAALIAPSLTELLADNRQASAAMDVVRLVRQTRAQAHATGYAQMIRFRAGASDPLANFGLGTFSVYAGMNSKCRQTPWAVPFAVAPLSTSPHAPKFFEMSAYNPVNAIGGQVPRAADTGRQVIATSAHIVTDATPDNEAALNEVLICYQPNGYVWTGQTIAALDVQTQPIVFRIRRWIDTGGGDVARGQERQVLLPVGGNARIR